MRKLLVVPNDKIEAYRRISENDFLNENNPMSEGMRFFDKVHFLNWKEEQDDKYSGVISHALLKDKSRAWELTSQLKRGEIEFNYPLYSEVFDSSMGEIEEIVRKVKPDVIRTTIHPFAIELGAIAKQVSGAPMLINLNDVSRITCGIHEADTLVCQSRELEEACTRLGYPRNKIVRIPNGIDLNVFCPQSKSSNSALKFPEGNPKFVNVARVSIQKNVERTIDALEIVRRDFPDVTYLHYGSEDPESMQRVNQRIEKYGLEGNVFFAGTCQRDQLPEVYSWGDALVFPTLWEGYSRSLREALACGTPAITSNSGSVTEIVKEGYNGLLVDPRDPEDIASRMVEIAKNGRLRARLSKNARESVKGDDIKLTMKKYFEHYSWMLSH